MFATSDDAGLLKTVALLSVSSPPVSQQAEFKSVLSHCIVAITFFPSHFTGVLKPLWV